MSTKINKAKLNSILRKYDMEHRPGSGVHSASNKLSNLFSIRDRKTGTPDTGRWYANVIADNGQITMYITGYNVAAKLLNGIHEQMRRAGFSSKTKYDSVDRRNNVEVRVTSDNGVSALQDLDRVLELISNLDTEPSEVFIVQIGDSLEELFAPASRATSMIEAMVASAGQPATVYKKAYDVNLS